MNKWMFGYGSPVTIGVFRILIATMIFVNSLFLVRTFGDWFTETGYNAGYSNADWQGPLRNSYKLFGEVHVGSVDLPRIALIPSGPPTVTGFGLLDGIQTFRYHHADTIAAWVLGTLVVSSLFTALGLFTRLSSVVMAVALVSVHNRTGLILNGGDTLMRCCALYLVVSPAGAACSLDRLRALAAGKATLALRSVSLWPQRVVELQIALVYFATVWLKWQGTDWHTGLATWYTMRIAEFARFPIPDWMRQPPFIQVWTWGTLAVELALATLVFAKPYRKWVLLSGIVMHGFIEYSMNIPLFGMTICSCYVVFYESDEIAGWATRMGQRLAKWKASIKVPVGTALSERAQTLLKAGDPFGLIEVVEAPVSQPTAAWAQIARVNPFLLFFRRDWTTLEKP